MDIAVDIEFPCDDYAEVCEVKDDYENGQANRLFRRTFSNANYKFEMYERKDGNFVIVKKESKPLQIVQKKKTKKLPLDTEGNFCFSCYDKNASRFVEILEDLRAVQSDYKEGRASTHNLKRLDDFRVSRSGALIHEECFEPGRFKFDVEEAVVDGIVKTMAGLIELEDKYLDRYPSREPVTREEIGASDVLKSHVPRLLAVLDPKMWKPSSIWRTTHYKITNKEKALHFPEDYEGLNGKDPCYEVHGLGPKDCEFISKIPPARPLIFCQADIGALKVHEKFNNLEGASAYTSTPDHVISFSKKGLNGKIKMYNGPGITFLPKKTKNFDSGFFQSALTHELFHNMGYIDEPSDYNHYCYTCQAAIHYEYHRDVLQGEVSKTETSTDCTGPYRDYSSADTAYRIQSALTADFVD